ncbi:diablo IAP-binding mitochondrial protein-like isoform X2 [Haemaphysalis longicornis]
MFRLLWRVKSVRSFARYSWRRPELAVNGGKAALLTSVAAWGFPVTARCSEDDDFAQLRSINPEMLTHEFLIKQASIVAVEATCRVLIQLTAAILDAHEEYCKSLNKLSGLLKRFETEVGLCSGDDAMWMELIAARGEANDNKARVLSLESRLQSVTGLLEAMAETAFANGAEYAGVCVNERLLSAEREIKTAAQKTASLEDDLNRAHRDAVLSSVDKTDAQGEGELKKT